MNEPSPELIAAVERAREKTKASCVVFSNTRTAIDHAIDNCLSELQQVVEGLQFSIAAVKKELAAANKGARINALVNQSLAAEYVALKQREEQAEKKLREAVCLIDSGINGKKLPVYLEEQFPASIGHLPLVEYDQRIRKALSSTQQKEGGQ